MIKITPSNKPIIREVKAPFVHSVNGEIKTEEIRVRYRSLSVKALKEQKQILDAKGDDAYISDTIHSMVEELPDFVGEDGNPITLSLEFFEQMDLENLKAIRSAIDGAINPK